MRWLSLLVSLLVVLIIGLVAGAPLGVGALAQEGTPPAGEEFEAPEGVGFVPLGFGTAQELPAAPADLVLARFTLDPGAGFDIGEDDPSVVLVYVESGAFTFRVEAPMRITRAASIAVFATPGADEGALPEAEEVAAGTEFTLEAGDSAVFPPNVPGEVRNDGTEPAVALLTLVGPPEAGAAGTPAP
jgi:quercetin dioxygenase-like cupin family protein